MLMTKIITFHDCISLSVIAIKNTPPHSVPSIDINIIMHNYYIFLYAYLPTAHVLLKNKSPTASIFQQTVLNQQTMGSNCA